MLKASLFLAALLLSTLANGQGTLFRAYVASDGNDANPCSLPQPCRLLPAALTAVASGGEIWMLDSANYNTATVTIAKSVTILAVPGAIGSVVAKAGPAISVTDPGLNVTLRNLVLVPLPASGATYGIHLTGSSTVTVENSSISNMPSDGVRAAGSGAIVKVLGSTVSGSGAYAVMVLNGSSADIQGTRLVGNAFGGLHVLVDAASANSAATVSDCFISGGVEGVYALASAAGAFAHITVTRSTITRVGYPLDAETTGIGAAWVLVSYSTVTNTGAGWYQLGSGSVIYTAGNNHIYDYVSATGSMSLMSLY